MGKTLGEMSPEERRATIGRAASQFQRELSAAAPAIGRMLDEEDAELARRIEHPDSAENRLLRSIYRQLDDLVPASDADDADDEVRRLLAGLAEPMSAEEVAARMTRFREGLAKLRTDPAERARIERIARDAGVVTDEQ